MQSASGPMDAQLELHNAAPYPVVQPAVAADVSLPAALCDVALIDGYTCAAVGAMSISQWHDLVRRRQAPQPAIREPRFTRWRVVDVRIYLEERIRAGQAGSVAADAVIAKAKKASSRARAQRTQLAGA